MVVLAGPSSLDTVEGRRLAYVGASRARVEVAVVLPPECEESYLRRSAEFARLIVEAMLGGELMSEQFLRQGEVYRYPESRRLGRNRSTACRISMPAR